MIRRRLLVTAAAVLGLIAVCGLLDPPPARGDSVTYTISGNTAGLVGSSGYLDFQFNPAFAAPAATATITGFSTDGMLIGSPVNTGGASGTLPGTVKIVNSMNFNDALQQLTYGTKLSFNLSLTFTPDTANGTTFAFSFLAPNRSGYSTGPSGEALDITVFTATDIVIRGPFGPASNSPGFPTTPTLTVVPEPSSLVLLGLGVGVVAVAGYGRARARRRAA